MSSGFYQIHLHKDSKPKTAFVTHRGNYQFKRLPFGISGEPASYQHLTVKVLQNILLVRTAPLSSKRPLLSVEVSVCLFVCLFVCLSFCPMSSHIHLLLVDRFGCNSVVRTLAQTRCFEVSATGAPKRRNWERKTSFLGGSRQMLLLLQFLI